MCDVFCPWFVFAGGEGEGGGEGVVTGCEDGLDVICCGCEACGFSVVGVVEEEDFVFCGVCYGGCDALWDQAGYYTLSMQVLWRKVPGE